MPDKLYAVHFQALAVLQKRQGEETNTALMLKIGRRTQRYFFRFFTEMGKIAVAQMAVIRMESVFAVIVQSLLEANNFLAVFGRKMKLLVEIAVQGSVTDSQGICYCFNVVARLYRKKVNGLLYYPEGVAQREVKERL